MQVVFGLAVLAAQRMRNAKHVQGAAFTRPLRDDLREQRDGLAHAPFAQQGNGMIDVSANSHHVPRVLESCRRPGVSPGVAAAKWVA